MIRSSGTFWGERQHAELDYLHPPAPYGQLITLRAESAIWSVPGAALVSALLGL
jgi:hypothetical protein